MKKAASLALSIAMILSPLTGTFPFNADRAGEMSVSAETTLFDNISITPERFDFGKLPLGSYTDKRVNVTITNNKDQKLLFEAKNLSSMPDFSLEGLSENQNIVLDPGDSFTFSVKPLSGLTPASYTETLSLEFFCGSTYGTIKYPVTMVLENDGTKISASSEPLEFVLPEGYDPEAYAKTVTLSNTSGETIKVADYSSNADGFTIQPAVPELSIPAGGSIKFRVIPKAGMTYDGKTYTGELKFTLKDSSGSSSVITMDISRRITPPYSDTIELTPTLLDFGTLTEGYSSVTPKTVTIKDTEASHSAVVFRPESSYFNVGQLICDGKNYYENAVLRSGSPITFTVEPVSGRKPGSYEEQLTVGFENEKGERILTKTITAKYTVKEKTKASHTLLLTSDGNGSVSSAETTLSEGSQGTITAIPNEGYVFREWQIVSGSPKLTAAESSVTTLTMGEEDAEVKAVFSRIPDGSYRVKVDPEKGGSAYAEPAYGNEGDEIALHAIPDTGYYFVRYELTAEGMTEAVTDEHPDISFALPKTNVNVKAIFAPNPYKASFTTQGNGSVRSGASSGRKNTEIEIIAVPEKGYKFKEWQVVSGNASIKDKASADTTFTFADSDTEIKAVFVPMEYKVIFDIQGKGTANAVSSYGTGAFRLTAEPAEGYIFKEWEIPSKSGPIYSSEKSVILTCGEETVTVKVIFEQAPVTTTTAAPVVTTVTTSTTASTTLSDKASTAVTTTVTNKASDITTSKITSDTAMTTSSTTLSTTASSSTAPVTTSAPTTTSDIKDIVYGDSDLNGNVDLADVTTLAKYLLNSQLYPLGSDVPGSAERAKLSSDVNGDKKINSIDLSRLIEFNLGKIRLTDLIPK